MLDSMLEAMATREDQLMPVEQYEAGTLIEHRLMPGFTMTVQDTRDCETDANRPDPHKAYKVTDPEGNEDWLGAHDVQRPGEGLAWQ